MADWSRLEWAPARIALWWTESTLMPRERFNPGDFHVARLLSRSCSASRNTTQSYGGRCRKIVYQSIQTASVALQRISVIRHGLPAASCSAKLAREGLLSWHSSPSIASPVTNKVPLLRREVVHTCNWVIFSTRRAVGLCFWTAGTFKLSLYCISASGESRGCMPHSGVSWTFLAINPSLCKS